jgi:hypothetical protein
MQKFFILHPRANLNLFHTVRGGETLFFFLVLTLFLLDGHLAETCGGALGLALCCGDEYQLLVGKLVELFERLRDFQQRARTALGDPPASVPVLAPINGAALLDKIKLVALADGKELWPPPSIPLGVTLAQGMKFAFDPRFSSEWGNAKLQEARSELLLQRVAFRKELVELFQIGSGGFLLDLPRAGDREPRFQRSKPVAEKIRVFGRLARLMRVRRLRRVECTLVFQSSVLGGSGKGTLQLEEQVLQRAGGLVRRRQGGADLPFQLGEALRKRTGGAHRSWCWCRRNLGRCRLRQCLGRFAVTPLHHFAFHACEISSA